MFRISTQTIIILFAVFIVLWFVLHRKSLKQWTEEYLAKIREMEGFETKTYTYYPDREKAVNGVGFSPDDLHRESIFLLKFFKQRKHLVSEKSTTPAISILDAPRMSPAAKRPEIPPINFDDLQKSLKMQADSDAKKDNDSKSPASEDKKEQLTGMDDMAEYGDVLISNMDIYKYYSNLADNEADLMNKKFDSFFTAKTWADNEAATKNAFTTVLQPYDDVYEPVKFHFMQTPNENVRMSRPFTTYWISIVKKYRESPTKLKELKKTFYEIMKPTFVFSALFAEYKNNLGKYSDKTDALFLINKAIDVLSETPKPKLNMSETGAVYTFGDDKFDLENQYLFYDGIRFDGEGNLRSTPMPFERKRKDKATDHHAQEGRSARQ
jgi:hypothetical protein